MGWVLVLLFGEKGGNLRWALWYGVEGSGFLDVNPCRCATLWARDRWAPARIGVIEDLL